MVALASAQADAATSQIISSMVFSALIGDLDTGLSVGSVAGIPDVHAQGQTLEEVRVNLVEVLALLSSVGPLPERQLVATMSVLVG